MAKNGNLGFHIDGAHSCWFATGFTSGSCALVAGDPDPNCQCINHRPIEVDLSSPTCPLPSVEVGVDNSMIAVFSVSGGTPPFNWSQVGLPLGLTITTGGTDGVEGFVGGTPSSVGTFAFTVTVVDGLGLSASRSCQIDVICDAGITLSSLETSECGFPGDTIDVSFMLRNGCFCGDTLNVITEFITPGWQGVPAPSGVLLATGDSTILTARAVIPAGGTCSNPGLVKLTATEPCFGLSAIDTGIAGVCMPTRPQGLVATDSVCGEVQLSWIPSVAADFQRIYRSGVPIGDVSSGVDVYIDPISGGPYLYGVEGITSCGASDSVAAIGFGVPIPSPPIVTASDSSFSFVRVDWTLPTFTDSFRVYRNNALLFTVSSAITSLTDTLPAGIYDFAIAAGNKCGFSPPGTSPGRVQIRSSFSYSLQESNPLSRDSVFILEVDGHNDGPISAYSIALAFDPLVFALEEPAIDTVGTVASGARINLGFSTDSSFQVGIIRSFGCPPQIESGNHPYMKLRFRVKADAPAGPTAIRIVDLPDARSRMTSCDGIDRRARLDTLLLEVRYGTFVRGDLSGDGIADIYDVFLGLSHQYGRHSISCKDAADYDDNGVITISDVFLELNYPYESGAPPAAPYPECGYDMTYDSLGCDCHPLCMSCAPFPAQAVAARQEEEGLVHLALGDPADWSAELVEIPVLLESGIPILALEYSLAIPGESLELQSVNSGDFDFASGRAVEDGESIRIGQVKRLDFSETIPAGRRTLARVVLARRPGGNDSSVSLAGGIFITADGRPEKISVDGYDHSDGADEPPPSPALWAIAIPNPFNPSTTIRYSLPSDNWVSIIIYDTTGRSIAQVVDGFLGAGAHEVIWDGTSMDGNEVASGVFFYRVKTDKSSFTGKLNLVR